MINKFRYRKPLQAQSNGASDTVSRKSIESKSSTMNLIDSKENTVFSSVVDAETKKKLKVKDAVVCSWFICRMNILNTKEPCEQKFYAKLII